MTDDAAGARDSGRPTRGPFDAVPVGLYRSTPEGRLLDANPALAELCGFDSVAQMQGLALSDLYIDRTERHRWMQAVADEGLVRGFEFRLQRRDGTVIWARDTARAVPQGDGTLVFEGAIENITEERRLREIIARAKLEWERTFDAVPDPIMLVDRELKIQRANRAMAELYGTEPAKLIGQPCPHVVHGTDAPPPGCPSRALFLDGARHSALLGPEDGLPGHFVATVAPLTDENGAATGCVHVMHDVSDLRELQDRLVKSEEQFRNLAEENVAGVYFIEENRFAYVNRSLAAIFGYTQDEVIGKLGPIDLTWPEDHYIVTENLRRRFAREVEGVHYAFRGLRKDGSLIHVEVFGRLVELSGRPIVLGTLVDVSDRHRLETEREQAMHRMEVLIESLPEGIALLDSERRITISNPAARAALRLLDPQGLERGRVTRLGDVPVEEIWEKPAQGMPREIGVGGESARRIFEVHGGAVSWTGAAEWALTLREVTEERAAVSRMQQQDRLAAVGRLAAGVAHDFNNLLQAITLSAEMIDRKLGEDDATTAYAATIRVQAKRGSQLVRQILDFARKTIRRPRPTELGPFLAEALELLRATIREDIRIELAGEAAGLSVVADPAQLQQLLTNLVVNAADAMAAGGRITVGVSSFTVGKDGPPPHPEMPPGTWAVLTVEDTGAGMSPEVRSRVFEPFFTTKREERGTGLGLAQVYGIVKQHGGYVDVDSEAGRGTRFTVHLPVDGRETPPPAEEERRGDTGQVEQTGRLVLLAEDDPGVRDAACAALATLGHRVLVAEDGEDAFAIWSHNRDAVDLVLTDVVMPTMGGIDLARRLNAAGARAEVVLMTGYPLSPDSEAVLELGVRRWLQKPFTVAELARCLARPTKT